MTEGGGGRDSALQVQVQRAASQLSGVRPGGDQSPDPRGGDRPGLCSAPEELPGLSPSLVPRSQLRRPLQSLPGKAQGLGDGSTSACPPMLSCAMFSWSPLPQSARAQPLWVRPSRGRSAPFSLALLFPLFFRGHFSLAELALPSPHSSCKRPWTTPGHPALPRLLPSLLTRRARLKQNSRPSFRGTRASPREMRGEREFWRLALSPFLGSIGA